MRRFLYGLLISASILGLGASHAAGKDKDADEPVLFQADRLTYSSDGSEVRLSGNVEASTTSGRTLNADAVTYDRESGRVTASGHVILRETTGEVLTADKVEVTGDLKDGVIENIGLLFAEHARLAAARGTRTGGTTTTLDSAVFSPCEICAEKGETEPLWQIKAIKVTWDKTAKRISYEDATFELFGTPLLTVPVFSHSDFTVKNQSGFLFPTFGQTSDLGYFIETRYHLALAPSYDLTAAVLAATQVTPVLKLSWRQRTETGSYWLSGSFTYDDAFDGAGRPTGEHTTYSHIFGRGRFKITEQMGWGFDLERTSNDTYLERYDISDADRLTSRAYMDWRDGRSSAEISAYSFQGLRASDDPGLTPLVLPEANLRYLLADTWLGGEVGLNANVLSLTRARGPDTQRFSAGVDWRRPEIFDGGQAVTFFATLRGDLYRLGDPNAVFNAPGSENGDVLARAIVYAGVDARWPFVRQTEGGSTQIVEPIAQVILAPYGDGPDGIPNEDSQSLEFDDTNLFSPIKFTGLDLVESGPRANLGLRFAQYFPEGASFEVLAGVELRARKDPAFANSSGLGDVVSDYVSRISFTPWPGLTIVNRLRLDKDTFSVRRNEVYVQGTGSFFEIDAAYLKLENDPTLAGLPSREEASLRTRVYVSDYWSVIGGFRRDIEDDRMIETRFAVAYEDECSFLELGWRRRYTRDRGADPGSTIILSVRLKMLGDDGTAEPLFQRDPYLNVETRDASDFGRF
ncbi:MAG: LPS-assembly protein LptD [Alphaproteobacteria bacterium]|nr:LPS-assembly protein LptD [Alphaproteobacteria bacterium]